MNGKMTIEEIKETVEKSEVLKQLQERVADDEEQLSAVVVHPVINRICDRRGDRTHDRAVVVVKEGRE